MRRESLPLDFRQLIKIGLLIFFPIFFSAAGILLLPKDALESPGDMVTALGILLISILMVVGLLLTILWRREIVIADSFILVRHSFYTARIDRHEITGVEISKLSSSAQIGDLTKRNGIASFGFLSGWFGVDRGEVCFCAVSSTPIYKFRFTGEAPFSWLALSCSERIVGLIAAWARVNSSGIK